MTLKLENDSGLKSGSIVRKFIDEFSFVRGNFLIMVVSWLILDFFTELPNTYYTLYVEALGASTTTIGLLFSVGNIASALVQIPGGYLADKYGRRWLITSMTFVAAMSRLFFVYAPTWHWIMVGVIVSGLAGIYQPAMGALIADSLPKEKRGIGFSIINLIASVSTTPAPLFAGFLFASYGLLPSMRLTYKLVILGFLGAAFLRTRLSETVKNPAKINLSEMIREYPTSLRESIGVWGLVPRSAFSLFIVNVIMNFTSGLFTPVLAFYIIRDLLIGEISYSYLMAALPISMIILALPAGRVIDHFGKKRPLLISFVLWFMAILLMVDGDFNRILLAMIMVGLLMVMANSSLSALMADLVQTDHRGKVNGSMGFFSLLAGSIGVLIGGWLYDSVSHQLPFLLQLVFVLPAFLLTFFRVNEAEVNI